MKNIYSTSKIIYHQEILSKLKKGNQTNPIQMHLMPANKCNHNCTFCSYRIENNKKTNKIKVNSNITMGDQKYIIEIV